MELRWQCKDDMVMGTIQQYSSGIEQPLFSRFGSALGAGSVLTGIVPDAIDVTIFANLAMATHGFCTASQHLGERFMLIEGEFVILQKTVEVLTQHFLYCMFVHMLQPTPLSCIYIQYMENSLRACSANLTANSISPSLVSNSPTIHIK